MFIEYYSLKEWIKMEFGNLINFNSFEKNLPTINLSENDKKKLSIIGKELLNSYQNAYTTTNILKLIPKYFGKASTGTPIKKLGGAAYQKAILKWIGGSVKGGQITLGVLTVAIMINNFGKAFKEDNLVKKKNLLELKNTIETQLTDLQIRLKVLKKLSIKLYELSNKNSFLYKISFLKKIRNKYIKFKLKNLIRTIEQL
jgi:hypothetical protein